MRWKFSYAAKYLSHLGNSMNLTMHFNITLHGTYTEIVPLKKNIVKMTHLVASGEQ